MNLTLHIWRQKGPSDKGGFATYKVDAEPEMSFLEMLDVLNEELTQKGEEPVVFEHDCREGICGCCGIVINGSAHGPTKRTATCQLHMRTYNDGDELWLEPWRTKGFPILKDLMVDRTALDKVIQAGGFISVKTGSAPEANLIPVPRAKAELAMDAAECIGCGACVAQCPNGAGQLFTAAKVSQLAYLPQGQPERYLRVRNMVAKMEEYFGGCTNFRECEAVCPKGVSIDFIAQMNRDYLHAQLCGDE